MRGFESKYRLAGLAAVGLCAILLAPLASQAAMQSCPGEGKSTAVDQNRDALAAPQADYIRLHWQVVAPPLYRELPLDTDLHSHGAHHRDGVRPAYRGDSSRVGPADMGTQDHLKIACAQLEAVPVY
jgi:hypothetical protein